MFYYFIIIYNDFHDELLYDVNELPTKRVKKLFHIIKDKRWEKYYYGEVRTISYSVLPLKKAEWVLSAIDYHCFPKMLDWLMEELELSEEKLKQLIWDNSSKINYRENYDGKKETKELNKEDWEKIRKQVQSIARYAIKNYS